MSDSFNLSDIKKIVFTERSLTGLAFLFIRAETKILSYATLKEALFCEFKLTALPAQIHQILANLGCQPNKQLLEYFLKMQEIAQRGNVNDVSLIIQYSNPKLG